MSTNWCITIYTSAGLPLNKDWENHEEKFKTELGDLPIRGFMFQLECCPSSQRLHYQGFFITEKRLAISKIKSGLRGNHHFEIMKGKVTQNKIYCGKEDSRVSGPWKWGELPENAGKRNDLEAVKEAIKNGATRAELLEDHSEAVAKFPRFIEEYSQLHSKHKRKRVENWCLKDWQLHLWNKLGETPDSRHIYWVCDYDGGRGKTYLANLLLQEKEVFYCNGGKHADLLYAYNGEPIVIFDYVREAKDYVGYGPIEQLKNGAFFSTKYQSKLKTFNVPHVIIFANFDIDESKLSKNRIIKYHLTNEGMFLTLPHEHPNKICNI